jgi:hypothetical protein
LAPTIPKSSSRFRAKNFVFVASVDSEAAALASASASSENDDAMMDDVRRGRVRVDAAPAAASSGVRAGTSGFDPSDCDRSRCFENALGLNDDESAGGRGALGFPDTAALERRCGSNRRRC